MEIIVVAGLLLVCWAFFELIYGVFVIKPDKTNNSGGGGV